MAQLIPLATVAEFEGLRDVGFGDYAGYRCGGKREVGFCLACTLGDCLGRANYLCAICKNKEKEKDEN